MVQFRGMLLLSVVCVAVASDARCKCAVCLFFCRRKTTQGWFAIWFKG